MRASALVLIPLLVSTTLACGVDDRRLSVLTDVGGAGGKDGGARSTGGRATGGESDASSDAPVTLAPEGGPDAGRAGSDSGACIECRPNVVNNADFDADVSGWEAEPQGSIEWDTDDASALDWSGSIAVENDHVEDLEGMSAVGARQCARAVAGTTYDLRAKVTVRVNDGIGSGHLNVTFFAGTDCAAPQLPGGFTTSSGATIGGWEDDMGQAKAPQGTGSVAVRLVAIKPLRQPTLQAVFDEIRVVAE